MIVGSIILMKIVVNTKKINGFNFKNGEISLLNFGVAILIRGVYIIKIQLTH